MALEKVLEALRELEQSGDPKPLYAVCAGELEWSQQSLPLGSDDDVAGDDFDAVTAAWMAGKVPEDIYDTCCELVRRT